MAKRRNKDLNRRPNNDNIKGSSPEERQRSLLPGTKEYQARQALLRLKEAFNEKGQAEKEIEQPTAAPVTATEDVQKDDPSKDMAHDVGVRKFRRRRAKERQAREIKRDLDEALGENTPIHNTFNVPFKRSMDDELYDDGVNEKAFASDVVQDYKREIIELVNSDNDKDGDVDEDDITPALGRTYRRL